MHKTPGGHSAPVDGLGTDRAGPVARRLVCSVALVAIVPAASFVGTQMCHSLPIGSLDEQRWFHLIMSALSVLAAITVWRRCVLWTMGRRWLTTLVSMIPLVQVLYGQPVWNAARGGCINLSDTFLRHGQEQLGIGFWIWASIWVWWGWEKLDMSVVANRTKKRIWRVSPMARRILASLGSLPFVFGAWIMIQVALEDFVNVPMGTWIGFAISSLVAIFTWLLIWRRKVAWNRTIALRTSVLALACFGIPIAMFAFFAPTGETPLEALLSASPLLGWGVWMAGTITLWPMRLLQGEFCTAPRCMRCGYLLNGLTATRCPECGDEPTLDELWVGNTGLLE